MAQKLSDIVTAGVDTSPLGKDAIYKGDYSTGTPASSASYLSDVVALGSGYGTVVNGQIVVSVSSSNLTVAIKTLANTDASATDPIVVKIENSYRRVAGALSYTRNAATNWFNAGGAELAALPVNYFVYLCWVSGSSTVAVGFSRIPYAKTYADFSSTTTNEKYGAFSTTPASSDVVVNIGRFSATLSAGAGYTWTVSGDAGVINRPIFTTEWLDWLPTQTGFSANPTTTAYQYKLDYKTIEYNFRQGTNGTSNATGFTATMPFTAATKTDQLWISYAFVANSGTNENGIAYVLSASNSLVFNRVPTAAFTGSGGKRGLAHGFYEIA